MDPRSAIRTVGTTSRMMGASVSWLGEVAWKSPTRHGKSNATFSCGGFPEIIHLSISRSDLVYETPMWVKQQKTIPQSSPQICGIDMAWNPHHFFGDGKTWSAMGIAMDSGIAQDDQ